MSEGEAPRAGTRTGTRPIPPTGTRFLPGTPRPLVALAASGAAALVALTWLVARWSLQGQMAVLEKEVALRRATQKVDLPELLGEMRTFVAAANGRLALEKLRAEHAKLVAEHRRTVAELEELKRRTRLEERFSLEVGSSHTILNGKVVVGLLAVAPTYADVAFAGSPENGWRVGEYRDLDFGGARYRLVLEAIPAKNPATATFRVDALPAARRGP